MSISVLSLEWWYEDGSPDDKVTASMDDLLSPRLSSSKGADNPYYSVMDSHGNVTVVVKTPAQSSRKTPVDMTEISVQIH